MCNGQNIACGAQFLEVVGKADTLKHSSAQLIHCVVFSDSIKSQSSTLKSTAHNSSGAKSACEAWFFWLWHFATASPYPTARAVPAHRPRVDSIQMQLSSHIWISNFKCFRLESAAAKGKSVYAHFCRRVADVWYPSKSKQKPHPRVDAIQMRTSNHI
jgi:hypothetical protein